MTIEQAKKFLKDNRKELNLLFESQISSPVGGFYNPRVESVCGDEIGFYCHYDNFDNEEDSWTWFYSIKDRQFYN